MIYCVDCANFVMKKEKIEFQSRQLDNGLWQHGIIAKKDIKKLLVYCNKNVMLKGDGSI